MNRPGVFGWRLQRGDRRSPRLQHQPERGVDTCHLLYRERGDRRPGRSRELLSRGEPVTRGPVLCADGRSVRFPGKAVSHRLTPQAGGTDDQASCFTRPVAPRGGGNASWRAAGAGTGRTVAVGGQHVAGAPAFGAVGDARELPVTAGTAAIHEHDRRALAHLGVAQRTGHVVDLGWSVGVR